MLEHLKQRVVPKCIDDRSLAIAHELDDVFWHEDESGTWRKSRVDDATVQKLIQERSSTTVKAALQDLLTAPAARVQGAWARMQGAGRRSKAKAPNSQPRTRNPEPRTLDPNPEALNAILAALASAPDDASKPDVLAATGLSDGDWNEAIAALLDRGDVTRTGQKRGTRYYTTAEGVP